jgi:hypothetical protein
MVLGPVELILPTTDVMSINTLRHNTGRTDRLFGVFGSTPEGIGPCHILRLCDVDESKKGHPIYNMLVVAFTTYVVRYSCGAV